MDKFCGSIFWDVNRTWYSPDPYFTPCFEATILTWIPASLILLFIPLEFFLRSSSITNSSHPSGSIPYTPLNLTKVFLNTLLIITQLILLFPVIFLQDFTDPSAIIYPVELYTPITQGATYCLALFLLLCTKCKGVRSSGPLWIFWGVTCAIEGIKFRSTLHYSDVLSTRLYVSNVVSFALVDVMFLLNCWADGAPGFIPKFNYTRIEGDEDSHESPEKGSSYLSQLLFEWFAPLMWKGYRNPLDYKDLWDLNEEDKSAAIVGKFNQILKQEIAKKSKLSKSAKGKGQRKPQISVLPILFGTFGSTFLFGSLLKIIPDMMVFVSPMILQLLIGYINNANGREEDSYAWKGYLYTAIMFSSAIVQTLLTAQYAHRMYVTGLRVRTALVNAIYRKALVVSNSTKRGTTLGEIVNLMSVDVQKVMDLLPFVNYLWSSPLQVGIAIYFQWGILGPSVLAGLILMILIIPLNAMLVGKAREYQVMQMKYKDQRVKLMNEILSGIKVLKLYAWEPSFEAQIEAIRAKEIHVLKLAAILGAGMNFLWMCAPFLVSLATFATYVLIDENNNLDATKAFVSLSLFSVINFSVSLLPMTITFLILALVSLKRINKFMNCDEVDPNAVSHDPNEADPIVIENGNFTWDEPHEDEKNENGAAMLTPLLKDINLRIPPGSMVAVVGIVGCGKSTLLSALLGETNKLSGRVNVVGSVAYVAQQAWIQNVSLRDNILFGLPYDSHKYDRVIRACALKPDLEMLPAGDKTEIGEKGINLSGGQKQRVAIARAVYSNSDVYLFDDPLSAVDSHVGKHIFDKVLGPAGLLKSKTRVLVTHGVSFLPHMDQIIVMKDGEISETGTYQELQDAKGSFSEFLAAHATQEEEDEGADEPEEAEEDQDGDDSIDDSMASSKRRSANRQQRQVQKKGEKFLTSGSTEAKSIQFQIMSISSSRAGKNKLIEAEKSETKSVTMNVYYTYFKAAGWNLTTWTIILYALFQGFSVSANLVLSDWSELPLVNGSVNIVQRDTYLGVYGVLGLIQGLAIGFASLTMAFGILRSSSVLHHRMLHRIMRCPMYFFDTTPIGRIVNRFAKDVDTLDAMMQTILRMVLNGFFQVFSTLVVISYTTPIFIAVIVPIGVIYFLVQKLYVATSRQLKRLESVTRSPIYSHFGESVIGSPTIRAYRQHERFILDTEAKVDFNQKSYFPSITSNRWLAVRLETVGNLVIFFAALFAVIGRETLSSGLVGLSVTYALQITLALNMVVRWVSELETNLVAVERMKEYMGVPQEAAWEIDATRPIASWPESGRVEFNGYKTRYREGLDLVLRNVTCTILPGEKVGIVGRTGAGKSSLTLGLFRIVEAVDGFIKIDGLDISKLGLHSVRGRITIIPQDPVLFSGSLRLNLDPFEKHSDLELWRALELAHLKSFVKGTSSGLSHEISEGGENLSVGQRQLICLARALLRKTKILVLDEATAAVDLETDDLIQTTIKSEFKDCTVITIAHRLNTILDSTRVIVLDKGEIREFDSPTNLLNNKLSIFYSMAKDAGLAT